MLEVSVTGSDRAGKSTESVDTTTADSDVRDTAQDVESQSKLDHLHRQEVLTIDGKIDEDRPDNIETGLKTKEITESSNINDFTGSNLVSDVDADTIYHERLTKDLARTKRFVSQVDASIADLELELNIVETGDDIDALKGKVIALISVYETLAYVPAKNDVIDEATSSYLLQSFVREQAGTLQQLEEIKGKADMQLLLYERSISDFGTLKLAISEEISNVLKKIEAIDPNGGSQRNGTPDTLFLSKLDLCDDMISGLVIQQDRVMSYINEIALFCYDGQVQPLTKMLDALISAKGATVSFTPDTENSSLVKTLLLSEVLVEVKGRYKLRSYGV